MSTKSVPLATNMIGRRIRLIDEAKSWPNETLSARARAGTGAEVVAARVDTDFIKNEQVIFTLAWDDDGTLTDLHAPNVRLETKHGT